MIRLSCCGRSELSSTLSGLQPVCLNLDVKAQLFVASIHVSPSIPAMHLEAYTMAGDTL